MTDPAIDSGLLWRLFHGSAGEEYRDMTEYYAGVRNSIATTTRKFWAPGSSKLEICVADLSAMLGSFPLARRARLSLSSQSRKPYRDLTIWEVFVWIK